MVTELVGEDDPTIAEPWTDERYNQDDRNEFRAELRQKAGLDT